MIMKTGIRILALAGVSLALIGCQSLREATGVAKLPPDEFAVMTKAPLIIPPDFNLRPPQPGAPDRNGGAPADQARAALFPQDAAAAAPATAAAGYSPGEMALLNKSGGVNADPNVRRAISADSGFVDQGPGFANRLLNPQGAPAAPAVAGQPAPAPAAPAAAPPPQVRGTTQ
jgi:hypothetical protein